MVSIQLKCHTVMHNFHAIFAKFLDICKNFSYDLVNEQGNIPRRGVIPSFSDIEVVSLALSAETIGIDSENYLFSKLTEYKSDFPNLISRRQYNDRRKLT
ncbi:MAG: IS982 family transposase, partial [Dysgonomonas sp.]